MGDPMAMASSMMAMQAQAQSWIAATHAALTAAGLGFTAADLEAIAASQAAHPTPEGYGPGGEAPAVDVAAAQEVARRAMSAEYPPDGLASDDPRLAPVEGVTLALLAIGAKALRWSTDEADIERVVRALGVDRAAWDRASAELHQRVADDVVLGAFYGQLYSFA